VAEIRAMIKKMIKHSWVIWSSIIRIIWNGQNFIGFEFPDGRVFSYSKCTTDMKMHLAEKGLVHNLTVTFGRDYVMEVIRHPSCFRIIL